MYHMAPFYDSSASIDLPTKIYKQESFIKPILGSSGNPSLNGPIMLNGTPISVEELERRQDAILERLHALRIEVDKLLGKQLPTADGCCSQTSSVAVASSSSRSAECIAAGKAALKKAGLSCSSLVDLVLMADPTFPPLSVFVLYSRLCDKFNVLSTSHLHSSVLGADVRHVPDVVSSVFSQGGLLDTDRSKYQLGFTVVWKKDIKHPTLTVRSANSTPIVGEGTIARYLARLVGCYDDTSDIVTATRIDDLIDLADQLLFHRGNPAQHTSLVATVAKQLDGGKKWVLGGEAASLADIVLWSAVKQSKASKLAAAVNSWVQQCASLPEFNLAGRLL